MVKTWVQQPSQWLYCNFKRNNLTKKAQKHSSNQKHIHCPTRKTSENYTPHRKKFCRSMSIQNNFIISHGECKSLFSCMKWSLVISCKLDPLRKWLFLTSRLLHFSMLTLFSFKIKNERWTHFHWRPQIKIIDLQANNVSPMLLSYIDKIGQNNAND